MRKKSLLSKYYEKRDFSTTPEPKGKVIKRRLKAADSPRFVIQKHAARRLHYDLRLEAEGVLKSWAVPKGPSVDPADRRLAIMTEDHPIHYETFEGTIPLREYGAGRMIVWDKGYYRNLTRKGKNFIALKEAIEKGKIIIWLEGQKLRGGWMLTRINKETREWLLIRMRGNPDQPVKQPVETEPASVLSGRTIEELEMPK